MDNYTLQQELEALAGNAYNPDNSDQDSNEPISATTARWRKLFGLTEDEAVENLMSHRQNLTRTRVSDEHWQTVKAEKESQGYDKEAYEYELDLQRRGAWLTGLLPTGDEAATASSLTYLVQMEDLLDTPEKIQQAAGMDERPAVVDGYSVEDGRAVSLCCIDSAAKESLLQWTVKNGKGFEPTILVNPRSLR